MLVSMLWTETVSDYITTTLLINNIKVMRPYPWGL